MQTPLARTDHIAAMCKTFFSEPITRKGSLLQTIKAPVASEQWHHTANHACNVSLADGKISNHTSRITVRTGLCDRAWRCPASYMILAANYLAAVGLSASGALKGMKKTKVEKGRDR